MVTLWDLDLVTDKLLEVCYPNNHADTFLEAGKVQMSSEERGAIVNDIYKHPLLDLESMFEHVRNTDFPLPSTDIEAVNTLITECQTEISEFNTKIKGLIPSIMALSRELTETSCRLVQRTRQLKLAEYLTSRPKHLPQDVLEQIFLACWELQDFSASLTVDRVPFQLAAVSHRWRAIALSMPVLWSNIRVKWPSSISRAKTWFHRCRNTPILTLDLSSYNRIESSQLENLLDYIRTSTPPIRLRSLELDISNESSAEKTWAALLAEGGPGDQLEELVIRDAHQPDPIPPSVKRLFLHNPPTSWKSSPPPVGLTVLFVTMVDYSIHWRMIESILFHCPNLQRVTLRTAESGMQPHCTDRLGSFITPTTLPNLVYLGISNDSNTEDHLPKDFLGNFHLPNLRVFEYKVESGASSRPAWLIAHPVLAHIRRLVMQIEPEVSLEDFSNVLSTASSLEELSVCCTSASLENLLKLLSGTGSSSGSMSSSLLLPSLKSLHLGGWEPSDIEPHTPSLSELIKAWSPAVRGEDGCLTHLTFQSWYDESDTPTDLVIGKTLREVNPALKIRAIRYTTTFLLANIPLLFTTYPCPFNGSRDFEVMDAEDEDKEEGKWKLSDGFIYNVV